MKHHLLLWAILLFPLCSIGQDITRGEYFFNGNTAVRFPLTINNPAEVVNLDLTLDLPSGLPDGFNTIFFQFWEDTGEPSFVYSRVFYKQSPTAVAGSITYLEYFIDNDPGLGAAVSVGIPNPASGLMIDFTATFSGLEEGFHWLYLRARDSNGQWSLLNRRLFYVQSTANTALSNIVAIRYFFRSGNFESEIVTKTFDPAQPSLMYCFFADVSALTPGQTYDFFILAVNEAGAESIVEKRTISCCQAGTQNCDTDVEVTEDVLIDGTYVVGKNITTDAMIQAPSEVLLEAGESIRLLPGFEAASGSGLIARIIPCNSGNNFFDEPLLPAPSELTGRDLELSVFPNPSSGSATTRFHLDSPSDVKISLIGYASRQSAVISRQVFEAGDHTVDLDFSAYPAGIYFLVFQTSEELVSRKLVISR